MRTFRTFPILVPLLILLLGATHVLASPSASLDAAKTPGTPGPPDGKTPGPPLTPPGQSGLHGNPGGIPEHYRGTLTAVDAGSITVQLADGSSVIIGLGPETRIKVPGTPGATWVNLQVGMTVMVQAVRDSNDALVARMVLAVPGKPVRTHRVGWVTEYTAGTSISILAHDGNVYTFALTADPKILPAERAGELAVGARVTVIAPRDPAVLGWTAVGVVIHPEGSGAGSMPAATATATP